MSRRTWLAAILGAALALPAAAQESYPTRAIRYIVPFAAGGPSDIVARIMAPRMAATLGQPVVVENRVGAGGVTGVDVAAKAAPDGYTFAIGSAGALAISPNLGRGTPYTRCGTWCRSRLACWRSCGAPGTPRRSTGSPCR
ncbi:MAG: hypothetical protein K2X46_12490, partial [Roseomonas sp.]|nr:hypothetical protein [Roseomonas sp.]